mmetsp:Transcript_2055/g.6215  ORF Transcript_2055/g.6215 Transcript_2055/m.6215 type:complete len:252 (+) Transcript_2055:39-794(+)
MPRGVPRSEACMYIQACQEHGAGCRAADSGLRRPPQPCARAATAALWLQPAQGAPAPRPAAVPGDRQKPSWRPGLPPPPKKPPPKKSSPIMPPDLRPPPSASDVDSDRVVSTVPSGFRTVFSVMVTFFPLTIFVVVEVLVIMPPPAAPELELKEVNMLLPPPPPKPLLKKSSLNMLPVPMPMPMPEPRPALAPGTPLRRAPPCISAKISSNSAKGSLPPKNCSKMLNAELMSWRPAPKPAPAPAPLGPSLP